MPLSSGGLCEAVIWTPATAPSARTAKAVIGVGNGPGARRTEKPAAANVAAASPANSALRCRPS